MNKSDYDMIDELHNKYPKNSMGEQLILHIIQNVMYITRKDAQLLDDEYHRILRS